MENVSAYTVKKQTSASHNERDIREGAAFVMDTASEALELLAHYNSDFDRDIDRGAVSSLCRIISEYLHNHASEYGEDGFFICNDRKPS